MIQCISNTNRYKNDLKKMWKLCFPFDSKKFIDFYFDKICIKTNSLIFTEKYKLVSSMQIFPYWLKSGNKIFKSGYISGLMTLPNYRGNGYMSKLLNFSFNIMKKKGYEYTFLIPQEKTLIRIYERFGYHTIPNSTFHCPEKNLQQLNFSYRIYSSFHHEIKKYYPTYFQFLKKQHSVVLKTFNKFQNSLWTFFYENGNLFLSENGIAFIFNKKEGIFIKEFFYENENIKTKILQEICKHYKQNNIIFQIPQPIMIKELNQPFTPKISKIYVNMMMD